MCQFPICGFTLYIHKRKCVCVLLNTGSILPVFRMHKLVCCQTVAGQIVTFVFLVTNVSVLSISLVFSLFSPLGKLAGRAIYFTDVFSLFYKFFLMVDFLAPVAQTLMEQSSPKFQDW